jgi:hypothetical protein
MLPVGEGFDVPTEHCPASDWTWFKVKPGHVLCLGITSSSPCWYVGHFHNRRMVPCLGESCELCSRGVGAQVRYVFGCMEPLTGKRGLIELGRNPALLIRDRAPANGGLRGMVIAITRYSNSKLSRLEIDFPDREAPAELWDVPEPELRRALVSTWQSARCPIPVEVMKAAGIREVCGSGPSKADSVAEKKKAFLEGHRPPDAILSKTAVPG